MRYILGLSLDSFLFQIKNKHLNTINRFRKAYYNFHIVTFVALLENIFQIHHYAGKYFLPSIYFGFILENI